ncbi:hypothetical protein Rcas_3591 [Roseiflexus castenholzii DSM 13941]|uniref:Uncharacterized protein n=1 Tax=Roseiflexus castenholzii (strain DSM 13941 / HLO8) TaxID=383372 RepID=A7NPZ4_ROSCS|nr:hypothetical protein Rcas_3591 [Roseiflexus castenholzii DSM 13941]
MWNGCVLYGGEAENATFLMSPSLDRYLLWGFDSGMVLVCRLRLDRPQEPRWFEEHGRWEGRRRERCTLHVLQCGMGRGAPLYALCVSVVQIKVTGVKAASCLNERRQKEGI